MPRNDPADTAAAILAMVPPTTGKDAAVTVIPTHRLLPTPVTVQEILKKLAAAQSHPPGPTPHTAADGSHWTTEVLVLTNDLVLATLYQSSQDAASGTLITSASPSAHALINTRRDGLDPDHSPPADRAPEVLRALTQAAVHSLPAGQTLTIISRPQRHTRINPEATAAKAVKEARHLAAQPVLLQATDDTAASAHLRTLPGGHVLTALSICDPDPGTHRLQPLRRPAWLLVTKADDPGLALE